LSVIIYNIYELETFVSLYLGKRETHRNNIPICIADHLICCYC